MLNATSDRAPLVHGRPACAIFTQRRVVIELLGPCMRVREDGVTWVRAEGLRLFLLDVLRADGLTLPWRAVYLRPSRFDDADLRAHELVHIAQIERDGALSFSLRYVWWLVRYGYAANPYEIEAYDRVPRWPGRRSRLRSAKNSTR